MRVRTCEAGDVYDVFTRMVYTCEVFVSAVALVCVRYSGVTRVYVHDVI